MNALPSPGANPRLRLTRGGSFLAAALLVLSLALAGQAQSKLEPRTIPLRPEDAVREGRLLVADLLSAKPVENSTNHATIKIRADDDTERSLSVTITIFGSPTNWTTLYETAPDGERLTVLHAEGQPNRYLLAKPASPGQPPTTRELPGSQTMIPFAGSDFWIADLGLEFLGWPQQRVLWREVRQSQTCDVLESVNPNPTPEGYSRILSWVAKEHGGIVHADAYDARGKRFKQFDPMPFRNSAIDLPDRIVDGPIFVGIFLQSWPATHWLAQGPGTGSRSPFGNGHVRDPSQRTLHYQADLFRS